MLLDPVMASAGVSSANRLRRDASRVCTARIARVYLHRNGTRKGLYILLDVSSGRERRDENGLRANQTEFAGRFPIRFSTRNYSRLLFQTYVTRILMYHFAVERNERLKRVTSSLYESKANKMSIRRVLHHV